MSEKAQKFEELLSRSGVEPDDVERIDRMNVWQGFIKDEDGNIQTTDLYSMQIRPKQEEKDISQFLVSQAPPTVITPSRRKRPQKQEGASFLTGGDAQIPFHDPRAMELFQTINAEKQPDDVILVGDMVDLPSLSRFAQRPEWVGSTQGAIDTYHNFLAQLRADNPKGNITVVHGNHEQRLDNYIAKNAAEVLGLRRANMGKELAVLTLQYLTRYDDLNIQAIDGYPNGTLWLEDNLKFVHGTNVKKGGSNAAKYLNEERESTIYGHTHRQELAYRTFAKRLGGVTIAAASPGALCLTDGSVPGFNHTVDAQGVTVKKSEDWQSGMLFGYHDAEQHEIEPALITPRGVRIEGKLYNV
jgi:predicted phosphodiesterase